VVKCIFLPCFAVFRMVLIYYRFYCKSNVVLYLCIFYNFIRNFTKLCVEFFRYWIIGDPA
jgi:hypothetical protein